MNKTVKIIALCLIGIIGLYSSIIVVDEVSRYIDNIGGSHHSGDYSFPISSCILMLSIPSFLFNLKTLKLYRTLRLEEDKIIDHNLLDLSDTPLEKTPIDLFLWIGNFAFGICTSILGVFLLIFIQDSFSLNELPRVIFQHMISLSLVILGPCLMIDEWKMRKLATI